MDRQSALHFGVGLAVFSVVLMDLATNSRGRAARGVDPVLRPDLHRLAEAAHRAEHRHRRRRGAFPPLIGWVAATGQIDASARLLFAIIFLWTPPHFWALSLFVRSDYAAANVPMLPVVAGIRNTRLQILLYSLRSWSPRSCRSRWGLPA